MSLKITPKINQINNKTAAQADARTISFGAENQKSAPEKQTNQKLLKAGVLLGSATAVALTLNHIAKGQGHKLFDKFNLKSLKNPKTWTLAKLDYKEKDIIKLATASVAGGLGVGVALDKKNTKAKLKESVMQMVGNILIPIGSVSAGVGLFTKAKPAIMKKIPQLKSTGKIAKTLNSSMKALPAVAASLGSLAVGIVAGHFVSGKLNEILFNSKKCRKVEPQDFSGHIDDICLAASLVSNGQGGIGGVVGKVIPAALVVPGYQTGTKQE